MPLIYVPKQQRRRPEKNKLHLEISTLAAGEAIAIYAARLTTHNKKKMGEFL